MNIPKQKHRYREQTSDYKLGEGSGGGMIGVTD